MHSKFLFILLTLFLLTLTNAEPIIYYNFEEINENVVYDLSKNFNDGKIYDATLVNSIYGKGLKFYGTGEYVTTSYKKGLDISKKITIEAWIKKDKLKNFGTVVASNAKHGNILFGVYPDGRIGFHVGIPGDEWNVICTGGNIKEEWNHIAGTYDASTGDVKIFLNGNLVKSCQGKPIPIKNPTGFSIGYNPQTIASFFNGTIDEVKIHNNVLTEAEIKNDYEFKFRYSKLKPVNSKCSNNNECQTGKCFKNICKIPRYCENDNDCDFYQYCDVNVSKCKIKLYCEKNEDCKNGYCENNKCVNFKEIGEQCSENYQCETKNCIDGTCKEKFDIFSLFSLLFAFAFFFSIGFIISLIRQDISFIERIIISFGLGIAIAVLGIFVLNHFFDFRINFFSLILFFLIATFGVIPFVYFIIQFKKLNTLSKIFVEIKTIDKIKILKAIILILTIIFIFFLLYFARDYEFPHHVDEWMHVARTVQIIDTQTIPNVDTYFNTGPSASVFDLEVGFHIFLAEFFILSGQDPVLFYKFLTIFIVILSSLALFILAKRITNNFYAGIFSMLFFASLKTTIGILGIWLLAPLTINFILIFLFFYFYIQGMSKNSLTYFIFSIITISAIALIHAQSASWIYPVIILYIIIVLIRNILKINLANIKKYKNLIFGNLLLFTLPFLSFIYYIKILMKISGQTDVISTMHFFITKFIVFRGCPTERGYCGPDFTINFYGEIWFAIAMLGVIYLIYRFIKNKEDKFAVPILICWIAFMYFSFSIYHVPSIGKFIANLMNIEYSPFVLLTAYERIVYETLICLAALSGIGLYAILNSLLFVISKINFSSKVKTISFVFISLIIVAIVLNFLYTDYYALKPKLYKNIDMEDYKAMKFIEKNFGNYNVVFARAHISQTIYPISKNIVVTVTQPTTPERSRDEYAFFMGDCNTRKKILEKYKVDFVLEKYEMYCDFLKEIYHGKNVYVYEFKK